MDEDQKKAQREALEFYRGEGINVIPLMYREKKPIFSWKKYQSQKITAEEEKEFFDGEDRNLGIICGNVSNKLFVLDFDDPETFNAYFPKKEGLVYTKTGRENGGYHVYFKANNSIKILKCFNDEGAEVLTLKGESSYVVGASSVHSSGKAYKFVQKGKIPVLGGDPREEVKKRAISIKLNFGSAEESIDIEHLLLGVTEGARDTAYTHIVNYLRRQGSTQEEAFGILSKWNKLNAPSIAEAELYEKTIYHFQLPEPYSFYYITNPATHIITPDLEFVARKDLPTSDEAALTIDDVVTINDEGKTNINIDVLCDLLESRNTYVSVSDTRELLVYQNGIYVSGDSFLSRHLQQFLNAKATIHFKAEIERQIKDRNMIDRCDINADKTRLPVKNGLLNLETHKLEPFNSDIIYTSGLSVFYDENADTPNFRKLIGEILPKEDISTMQELFGYCMWRGYPSAKSFWLIGDGGNGKSTLTGILTALLGGSENVSHVTLYEMDGRSRFSTSQMYGKFANIIPEPSTARTLETPLLKALTGNSEIGAERKGVQNQMSFVNHAKIIIEANNIPRIGDEKIALWDRIIAINFPNTFRGRENENLSLGVDLSTPAALSGILNWALKGLARLQANNWQFSTSELQKQTKVSMQIHSNPLAAFKESWLSYKRKVETPKETLFNAFELFAAVNEIPSIYRGIVSKELLRDKRVTAHRTRLDGMQTQVFKGLEIAKTILCVYGWYRNRPLKEGEMESITAPENEVEVRTCSLADYSSQYLEPAEEVQEILENMIVIFNSAELIPLYKSRIAEGKVNHLSPTMYSSPETSKPSLENGKAKIVHVSPIDQANCSRCGKYSFLTHSLQEPNGKKELICTGCVKNIEGAQNK